MTIGFLFVWYIIMSPANTLYAVSIWKKLSLIIGWSTRKIERMFPIRAIVILKIPLMNYEAIPVKKYMNSTKIKSFLLFIKFLSIVKCLHNYRIRRSIKIAMRTWAYSWANSQNSGKKIKMKIPIETNVST